MLVASGYSFFVLFIQKVDIYSLGIIFFEMCYRPMATQMERIQILSNIRKELIEFPDDFHEICLPDQVEKYADSLLQHVCSDGIMI